MSEFLGYWWNSRDDLEIWRIENKNIVLYGWNGEIYGDCFEVDDELLFAVPGDESFEVRPVYNQAFEIVDYEII